MDAALVVHSLTGFFLLHALARLWAKTGGPWGKTIVSGTLATCVAGSVVGIFYW